MSYDHDDEGVRAPRPRFLSTATIKTPRIGGHARDLVSALNEEVLK